MPYIYEISMKYTVFTSEQVKLQFKIFVYVYILRTKAID